MKILITGGTGLIGTHLVPELLAAGHEVALLSLQSRTTTNPRLRYFVWNGKEVPVAVGPVDAVINMAGAGIADKHWTREYKALIMSSRLDATHACVTYIQAQSLKPTVFLSASAVGYYGTQRKQVLDETSGPGRDFLAEVAVKWEAATEGSGVRTVHFRTGIVLAKEGGAFPKLLTPFKLYAGGPIASGQQGFPWIHIADEVGLILFALKDARVTGALNLTAPEALTNAGFGKVLGRVMHMPSGLPVPEFAVKLLLGESAMLVTEGQLVAPKVALELGYSFKYPMAEEALKALLA